MAFEVFVEVILLLVFWVCTLLMLPDFWVAVLHARRLAEVVQAWQASGPHTTLLYKVRELLADSGWLAAPRDPLVECGIPIGDGLSHFLRLMLVYDKGLPCMERQVLLAQEEHLTFKISLLVAVWGVLLLAAAGISLLAVCLQGRRQQPRGDTRNDLLPREGSRTPSNEPGVQVNQERAATHTTGAHSWPHQATADGDDKLSRSQVNLEACVLDTFMDGAVAEILPMEEEVAEVASLDTDGREVSPKEVKVGAVFPLDTEEEAVSPDKETEAVLPLATDAEEEKAEAVLPLATDAEGKVEAVLPLATEGEAFSPEEEEEVEAVLPSANKGELLPQEEQQEASREVRRSLHVPPRLRERLAGPDKCFLEYLRTRHSVFIFMDLARKRMHVKGSERDVVECCSAVKALLAEWRRSEAVE